MSSGDFVGSLPVGMQSRGVTDLPYWPSQNMYVYKEVWVHPTWKARRTVPDAAWVAVVIPDGDVSRRREGLDSALHQH